MPHRNSTTKNRPESTVTLRRSPRILKKERPPPEYPKTPDPQSEKTSKRYAESKSGSNASVGLRRSPRFSGNKSTTSDEFDDWKCPGEADQKGLLSVGKEEVGINGGTETVARSEKRVTHASGRGNNESKQIGSVKKITEEELPVEGSAKIEKRVTRHSSRGINESKETESVEKITEGNAKVGVNGSKQFRDKSEKRTNHSSAVKKGKGNGVAWSASTGIFGEEGFVDVERAKVGVNGSKQFVDKSEKRTTRSSAVKKDKSNGVARTASTGIVDEEGYVDVERAKVGGNSRKEFGSELEKRAMGSCGASLELVGGEGKEGDLDRGVKEIGVKRKRNQFEEGHGIDKGWTNDQGMALQRAYFSAKPTPLFWKKVAKLVPGKSAKDCFNKLHSDHSTPPQPQTRLRSRKKNSPNFSLPTSTLLKPEEPITKKPSRRKQSRHLAQKTVRQLLQKLYNVDQNYEADLFSVLESTMNPSTQALRKGSTHSTPGVEQKDSGYLKKCRDRSSSAQHAKHMSRLSGSYGATLASPLVLKPVKNKALHEKYIDQLHCREAKRRAAKVSRGKENRKESFINIQKTDVIKAAKDALVFDAKDVIHQFHQVKVSGMSNFSDFDDDFVESDDDYEVESEP